MAIYQNGETYYLNGLADSASTNQFRALPAHEFGPEKLRTLMRIYQYSYIAQVGLAIPACGYGLISKIYLAPLTFDTVSLLAALISVPVFLVWISTLVLRQGVTTFALSDVNFQSEYSSRFYRFYAISGLSLLTVFLSAPWGEGWYLPFSVMPPVTLFFLISIIASSRAIKIRIQRN